MSMLWLPSRRTAQPQIAVPAAAGTALSEGLIGLYPGNGLRNASRVAYGDALASAPFPTVDTAKGRALVFDGTRYLSIGPAARWLGSFNKCSAGYWVYPTSLGNAYTALLSFSADALNFVNLFLKSNGKLAYYTNINGVSAVYDGSGATTLSANSWNFITQTYTKGGGCAVYVNGQLDALITAANNYFVPTSVNLEFGRDAYTPGRIYSGYMLGLSLYSRALSAGEQMSLYCNTWQLFSDHMTPLPTSATAFPVLSAAGFVGITSSGGYPQVTRT